eukprot:TRINITY_DN9751_c0_g1_i1.p1 TRINITY_DN9751_c0_g1~~TRINITY_DN9751_c0_g1_i1.p1  ORF type:complete len:475 (-),score=82.41 TRINITY_DN9751_c0_g1_i1:515-1918(-)
MATQTPASTADTGFNWKTIGPQDIAVKERVGRKEDGPGYYGTSGCVYAAEVGGFPVALKVMFNYGDARYTPMKERFGCDYKIVESLEPHPNVARCFHHFNCSLDALTLPDYNYDPETMNKVTTFVVMEKAETTLARIIAQARLQTDAVDRELPLLFATRSILQGLVHLHRNSIVHADLKPDNVGMDACGTIKLIDFGHAKDFRGVRDKFKVTLPPDYGRGGARPYMPPEIAFAQVDDTVFYSKYDVFSLGVLLYDMFGVASPFPEGFPARYDANTLPPLPVSGPIGTVLSKLCTRLLQCDPALRPSAEQALVFLEEQMRAVMKCVLVLGATGLGKSTTANKIVADETQASFVAGDGGASVTKQVTSCYGKSEFVVVDTPGFDDTDDKVSNHTTALLILRFLREMKAAGSELHCVLWFVNPSNGPRDDARNVDDKVTLLTEFFGKEIWQHVVVVFHNLLACRTSHSAL